MKIKIISTSDIHGTIFPYTYVDGKEMNYGLAKAKTLIDSLRDENTVVIDNGDTIEGSPFTNYHYSKKPELICPFTLATKEMNYDFINLGNHDFNYGEEVLLKHIKETNSLCLTSNVLYKGKQLGPDYVVKELANKKVAFFAVTTHFVPFWEKEENIKELTFIDAFDKAKDIIKKIKEADVDYVVCIYHGGFEKDLNTGEDTESQTGENQAYRMIKELKEINVMISGHQHRTLCGILDGVAYTQPAFNGNYLSYIEIDTDTNIIEPKLLELDCRADETILNICENEEKEVQKWLDTPLGHTDMDLLVHDETEDRLNKSQLATLINIIQKEYTGADLSGTPIFYGARGFKGDITMRHLVSTYFFPNTLMVKKISGKALKEYLEKTSEFWEVDNNKVIVSPLRDMPTPQHHNYDMIDGVEYTIKVSNPVGSRIISLTRNGVPIKDEDEFSIAINNYRASGGGNYDMIKNSPLVYESRDSVADIIAEYITKHKKISFKEEHNIAVIV